MRSPDDASLLIVTLTSWSDLSTSLCWLVSLFALCMEAIEEPMIGAYDFAIMKARFSSTLPWNLASRFDFKIDGGAGDSPICWMVSPRSGWSSPYKLSGNEDRRAYPLGGY